MPEFAKVAKKSDIPEGEVRQFKVGRVTIAVANLKGVFKAVSGACSHANGPLGRGRVVDGCCVECPWHGAKFDLSTGEVEAPPAPIAIPTYEVKVEGDDVYVKV